MVTSRHVQRARPTFAPGIAGGCHRRAPTTGRRGGTAAQEGRQGGFAARHTQFRLAQCSGWPELVLHASPARQCQPSHTPLILDPYLAGALRAYAVDPNRYRHRLQRQGRRCERLWLDLHRLRARWSAAVRSHHTRPGLAAARGSVSAAEPAQQRAGVPCWHGGRCAGEGRCIWRFFASICGLSCLYRMRSHLRAKNVSVPRCSWLWAHSVCVMCSPNS